jgi:PAS domain-containing protein
MLSDKSRIEPARVSSATGNAPDIGLLAQPGIPSTTLWRELVDAMFVFVGVFSPEGIVLDVNRAPLVAAGLSPGDVIGKPLWDTYWWSYSVVTQDDIRAVLRSVLSRPLECWRENAWRIMSH